MSTIGWFAKGETAVQVRTPHFEPSVLDWTNVSFRCNIEAVLRRFLDGYDVARAIRRM